MGKKEIYASYGSTWEDRKRELSAIYEQTEKEISAIRAELCKRGA